MFGKTSTCYTFITLLKRTKNMYGPSMALRIGTADLIPINKRRLIVANKQISEGNRSIEHQQ